MANLSYVRELIEQVATLMSNIADSTASLQSSNASIQFVRSKRRLVLLSRVLGPPPAFLVDINTGWEFWEFISRKFATYNERRQFVRDEFKAYYDRLLSAADADPGDELFLRELELVEQIGDGGFGIVYKAKHLSLGGFRAVKIFNPSFFDGNPGALKRFLREAELLSRVQSRHVVRFFDAGIAGNSPFIVTEFLNGSDLSGLVDRQGALSEVDTLRILRESLHGAIALHETGIVHRDIKPKNIMQTSDRTVLIDLGSGNVLAAALESNRTPTGASGTAGFIAPELLADPMLMDARTDIYSLGVTAHFLLTCRLVTAGDPEYYLKQQSVSSGVKAWIVRALQPIEARFESAEAMLVALEAINGP